jgi:hypothetical protein
MNGEKKYNHVEAFCLMQYICNRCGTSETFWNSRDGVTPFTCGCRCGGTMQHVNWQGDKCTPNHIPQSGQGIWITMPDELRIVVARIRVERAVGTPFEVKEEKREATIKKIADSFQDEEPWLIRWP